MDTAVGIQALLVDLDDVGLDGLRTRNTDALEPYVRNLFRQVERPRANLGGTGPPARRD